MEIVLWLVTFDEETLLNGSEFHRGEEMMFFVVSINWVKSKFTFVFKLESTVADKHSSYDYFGTNIFDFVSIVELDKVRVQTIAATLVQSNLYLGFNAAIFFIASALEKVSWDWRMVANLLKIDRAAVDPTLIGFA